MKTNTKCERKDRSGALIATVALGVMLFVMLIAFRTFAVSVGKVISWSTPKGKVFFEGSTHDRKKGLQCRDCHSNVFTMKKGMNKMTMQDINDGKFCGACHNGSRAFKASDPANCSRCHA